MTKKLLKTQECSMASNLQITGKTRPWQWKQLEQNTQEMTNHFLR